MTGLVLTSSEETRPWSSSPLIVSRDSFRPWTWAGRSIAYSGRCLYIYNQRTLTSPDTWSCPTLGLACVLMLRPISPELLFSIDILFYPLTCLCKDFMASPLWLVLVLGLYKEDYLQILNVCPFDYTAFAVSGKVGILQTDLNIPVCGCYNSNWPS